MRKLICIAAAVAVITFCMDAMGERIILKSGRIIEGEIIQQSDESITVETRDADDIKQIQEIPMGKVERIFSPPELVLQTGHTQPVNSMAISPDGKWLASGSYDNTVKLWSVETGELVQSIKGHSSGVSSVAFSPDGKWLASGSYDATVKLWSVETGKLVYSLEGHSYGVISITFSRDGQLLASGGEDNTVKLWSATTGELIHSLVGHSDNVESVVFSPDGKWLASSGRENSNVKIWSVEGGKIVHSIEGTSGDIGSFAFSPDSKLLATSGDDYNFVKIWSVETGNLIFELEGHSGVVTSVSFSTDGKWLASGGWGGTILWSMKTKKLIHSFEGNSEDVYSVTISPDGKWLASIGNGDEDNTMNLFSVQTGKLVYSLDHVASVTFSPDGKWLASTGWDETIMKLWSVETGKLVYSLEGYSSNIRSIAFSPDGKWLASGGWGTAMLWSMKTGELVHSFVIDSENNYEVIFSPDGKWLASSGSSDKPLELWSVETGKLVYSLKDQSGDVLSIAFSPDGKWLASSGRGENTVKLWSLETGNLVYLLEGHTTDIYSIAFSPDGKLLATSWSDDDTVKLWSVETGKLVHSINGGTGSVIFSPDGKWIASGSKDNTVKLWSVETGKLVYSLKGHSSWVDTIDFSPDGKWLASGSRDDTVKLWSVETGKLVYSLKGHSCWVDLVAFSPDGKWLASKSCDRRVKLWSVETGELVYSLEGHSNYITSIAFSPDGKWLASASADTIKLWNPTSGKLFTTLMAFNDGNWFVTDSAGRFDCSNCASGGADSGKKYIRWRVGNVLYEPDQFFRKFWEPGLFKHTMALGYVREMDGADEVAQSVPPEISIIGNRGSMGTPVVKQEPTIDVTVKIRDLGGGAEGVELTSQGRPVSGAMQDVTPMDAPTSERTYRFTVELVPGINRIVARAYSRTGIPTRDMHGEIFVNYEAAASPPMDLYMLTVGINEYKNAGNNLKMAVPDADAFRDAIADGGAGLYADIHQTELRNAAATRENIRVALSEIQSAAGVNDTVIIYLAGHGTTTPVGWFFIPHEITEWDPQYIADNALSDLELQAFLEGLKARKVVLVLDACQSGEMALSMRGLDEKSLVELGRSMGVYIFAASTDTQYAYEDKGLGHGVFTYALLQGLSGDADGNTGTMSGTVEAEELKGFTRARTPELMKQLFGVEQFPVTYGVSYGGLSGLGPTLVLVK